MTELLVYQICRR